MGIIKNHIGYGSIKSTKNPQKSCHPRQIQTNISSGQWRNADSYAGCVQAKFCSSACLGWSWQQGHRHESGLLHLVDSKEIGRMATLAYRYMDMVEYSRDKGVRPREECADRAMLDA